MRLLVTGDLHLGRRPSRLPDWALGDASLSTAGAWLALVEAAVAGEADLVILTGDVVDRRNHYFEAIGALEAGLRRLARQGIPIYAVAGNHDFDVLPRIAAELASEGALTLVGHGGQWERVRVERGGEVIHLDGWSFPGERVLESPLTSYRFAAPAGGPAIGLLHCDVGAGSSPYAAVSAAELAARPVAAWLLGHIHAPGLVAGSAKPLLYPGSPLPLDPGETGPHGPWWVEVDPGGGVELAPLPLAALRYETVPVSLTGVADREAAARSALRQALRRARDENGALRLLIARLALTGSVPAAALREPLDSDPRELALELDGAALQVDQVLPELTAALDLAALARLDDPAGELARCLLALSAGSGDGELLSEAGRQLERVHNASGFQAVAGDPLPGVQRVRQQLLSAGHELLAALVAQRPEAAA